MNCSRMPLSDRRYKPPPRVSNVCDNTSAPIVRPCAERTIAGEEAHKFKNRSCRSSSPQTSNSDHASTPESQKTPLIIYNLKISSEAKTLAPKNVKRSKKTLPPFCVRTSSQNKGNTNHQDPNMKVINDFIVQGTIIKNQLRQKTAHAAENSPDIIIDCEENECDECVTMCESAHNVFSNINTDLLLTMDYFEMDRNGYLPGDSRTPTPIQLSANNRASSVSVLSQVRSPTPTLLEIPKGFRPLSLRTPSPNTRSIIRVDLISHHHRDLNLKSETNIKDIDYNLNRLKEKRGVRYRHDKTP